MRLTRVHVDQPLAPGTELALPEAAAAHLVRVLRLAVGDACVLFDGSGSDYAGRVLAIGKREVRVAVGAATPVARESPLRITLLQGIARGEKMDLILQKATELGVNEIRPLGSQRSEVKLDETRAAKRLRLILDPFGALSLSTLEPPGGQSILLAVGPEGGWSPRDRDELVAAGFDGMRLGPRVLRTETAGLAAIAALQARFGDLA